jgi:hypothetical protein
MERLLNSSFRYLGIQDLRDVPLAVMEKLEKVSYVVLHGEITSPLSI